MSENRKAKPVTGKTGLSVLSAVLPSGAIISGDAALIRKIVANTSGAKLVQ